MAFDKVIDSTQLDTDLTAIADSIRGKTGSTESLAFPDGFTSAIDGISAPKEEQEKEIVISENGDYEVFPDDKKVLKRVSVKANVVDNAINELEDLIDNSGVVDTEGTVTEKLKVILDEYSFIYLKANAINFMGRSQLKQIKLDCKHYLNLSNLAEICLSLESVYLKNTQNVFTFCQAFRGCPKLKTIETLDCSSVVNADPGFRYTFPCPILENIKFVVNTIKCSVSITSPVLTAESIQSIIDGLATVSTAQTLTLHKDITLTDEQKATINTKGWTLAQ